MVRLEGVHAEEAHRGQPFRWSGPRPRVKIRCLPLAHPSAIRLAVQPEPGGREVVATVLVPGLSVSNVRTTEPTVTVPIPAPLPKVWPSEFAVARSSTEAFTDLAALWGIAVPLGTRDPCRFAKSVGLHCLSRQDSLVALRNLNHPAILTLYDNNGKPFHALLAELDGRHARFVAGAQSHELDVDVLESLWFGEFQLIWKPPAAYTLPVVPGGSGPAVPWLAHSLETLGQYDRNGGEERLEGHLLGALKRYQLAAGLTPDGLLGPQTLIHLLNSLGSDGPMLMTAAGDN
jgi:general secretion pathway protein A